MTTRSRGLVPNRGGGPAAARRTPADRVTYRLTGLLRWIDRDGGVAALLVQRANSVGRHLAGHTVTLDLGATAFSAADRNGDGRRSGLDLLPGEAVTVTARLPRALAELPPVLPARRLATHGPLR
jgi:hypothetical protein